MATKTLGIKFEVRGFQDAIDSISELKKGINETLKANREFLDDSLATATSEKKRGEAIVKANQNIFFSYLKLRKAVREQTQGLLADTKSAIKKESNSIKTAFGDYYKFNFGTRTQRQEVIVKEEKNDFKQRETYRKLNSNERSIILENRLMFRELFINLQQLVKEDLKEVIKNAVSDSESTESGFSKFVNIAKVPFEAIGKVVFSPLEAVIFGMLEKIGEELSRDFAEGLSERMQKNLGLQFREVGEDIGGAVGSSMYLAYEKIMTATKNSVVDNHEVSGRNSGIHFAKLLDDFGQILQGFVLSLGAVPIKARKRIEMDKKAIPFVKEKAGELMINRKLTPYQDEAIKQSKSITVLTGGANYDPQAGTTDYAYRTLQPMLRGSYVHPVKNLFSNAENSAEFDRVFGEMITLGLQNIESKAELLQFAKDNIPEGASPENQISDEDLEAIFDGEAAEVSQKITAFFKKISMPLPKILEVVFKGYNPDDIMMAAEGIFFKEKYPEKPLQFMGTSFGGFNAAGAAELMTRMGYKDIKAVGVTTPMIGMETTGNPDDYFSSIGDLDFLYELTLGKLFKGKVPKPDNLQVLPGRGKGHLLGNFLARSSEFRNYLQYFLKGRVDVPSATEYASNEVLKMAKIPENNAESAIVRTIKKYLGEKHDRGYIFNSEDLRGHRDHLDGLIGGETLEKVKNPQLKEFYEDYLDFLNTLLDELDTIEKFSVVGKKLKPTNSLRKAINFYPDLGHFINNHPDFGMDETQYQKANEEVEKNKYLVAFKQKLANESANFERTYRAMLGEDMTNKGYAYFDKDNYQNKANNELGGFIWYLEAEMLKDASHSEKKQARPYLIALKRLKQAMLKLGDTGELDTKSITKYQDLLGVDLKEYQAILKKNKSINVRERKGEIDANVTKYNNKNLSRKVLDIKPELSAYIWAINQELIKEGKEQIDISEAEYLGSGYKNHAIKAQGKVYKFARHTNPLMRRVQKIMGGKQKKYEGEIAALKKLKGQNAPKFVANGDEFLAMEEAQGVTLLEALESATKEERIELLQKAAKLLKSFHEKGVTHFDFHPGNIIKQQDGNLVAIDWEAAKVTKDKQQHFYDRQVAISRFQDILDGSMRTESSEEVADIFDSAYFENEPRPDVAQNVVPSNATPVSSPSRNNNLKNRYKEYLNQIITDSEATSNDTTSTVVQDIKGLDKDSQQNYLNTIRSVFNAKANLFRASVRNGQLEIAKDQGTQLLRLSALLKNLYAKLDADGEIDGEVKAKLLGMRRYASSVQTEVIEGVGGRGRSNIGLTDLFGENLEASSFGNVNSFVASILQDIESGFDLGARGRDAGTEFAEGVNEGAANEFGIESPSKVFKWIGSMVRKGFELGADGAEAGSLWAKDLIGSIKSALGIQSPAKVFEWIGKMSRIGMDQGLGGVFDEFMIDTDKALNYVQTRIAELTLNTSPENKSALKQLRQDTEATLRTLQERIAQASPELNIDSLAIKQLQEDTEAAINSILELNQVSGLDPDTNPRYLEDLAESEEAAKETLSNLRSALASFRVNFENEYAGFFDDVFSMEGLDEQIDQNINDGLGETESLLDKLWKQYPVLEKIGNALQDMGTVGLQLLALNGLKDLLGDLVWNNFSEWLKNLIPASLEVAMAFESMDRAVIAASRSFAEGRKNLEFIRAESDRLNIDLRTAQESYTRLLGAASSTSLRGFNANNVFGAFAETAAIRGFNADQQSRMFMAIEQAIAKGELRAEEVRGQLSEVIGDIQPLIAQAMGVPVSQLDSLMEQGQVKSTEVLPKVASQLRAQNALLASQPKSTQQVKNRFENSNLLFQEKVGQTFQPAQKAGYNALAGVLDFLKDKMGFLIKQFTLFISTIGLGFVIAVVKSKGAMHLLGLVMHGLLVVLVQFIALSKAARISWMRFLALSVAFEVLLNLVKIGRNQFPEARKDIDNLTKGIEAFTQAVKEASDSSSELNNNMPQTGSDLRLNEGLKLPDNRFGRFVSGMIGQENLNLDPVRRGLKWMTGGWWKTQAEKKEADFIVNNSDYQSAANQILMNTYKAKQAAERITDYDAQIAEIQSERLRLLPGDAEGLKASLEAERKIQELRDKDLKVLTAQQQNLQLSVDSGKRILEELAQRRLNGGITEENYFKEKAKIELTIELSEKDLKDVNDIIGKLPKELSEFNRQLKNAGLRVSGFMENRDRTSTQQRTQIINEGVDSGKGDTVIQLELEAQSRGDISDRISELEKAIAEQSKNLGSAALDAAKARLEVAAKNKGGLTTDVINDMLEQERDASEKEALSGALKVREWEAQLYQYQEQLAQSMQQSRSSLIDFNRTIKDYFFNLIQQIKEAQLEAKTLLSQISTNQIKNKLKAALVPGADSFVNSLTEGIQGILDQSQALIERTLGIEGNKIQLESEQYSLDKELQDFIKSVGGASDALLEFRKNLELVGGGADRNDDQPVSNSGGNQSIDALRRSIIGKESAGKFNAVNPHSGALGYGQVMPANVPSWTESALGKSLSVEEFLNNPEAQIKVINHKLNEYLQREIKASNGDLDLAVRRVAATWYSGQPGLYNNTRPQYYNGAPYPSIDDYTSDILARFKKEVGVNFKDKEPSAVEEENSFVRDVANLNEKLESDKERNLKLNIELTGVEKENLDLDTQNQLQIQARQFQTNKREGKSILWGMRDRLLEFDSQSKYITAERELQQSLRNTMGQFRDYREELRTQKIAYQDTAEGLKRFIASVPQAIAMTQEKIKQFLAEGNLKEADIAKNDLKILEQSLANYTAAVPVYEEFIAALDAQETRLPELEKRAVAFTRRQGELKIEAERYSKNSAVAQLKVNIATERGTNELKRQNELLAEQWRLSAEINRIRSENGDTPYADRLIELEKEQSSINRENINRGAYDRELNYEQKLLDLDSGIKNTRGGLLSELGLDGNKLQKEAAIQSENFRFYKELVDLRREYSAEPEKLDILINKATELNQVNLEQIKQQFKGLKETIAGLIGTNLGEFFNTAFETVFNRGEKERELKEQELQYREELLEAEQKYGNDPNTLDFAKDRISELNEQKLDKIRSELNLFSSVANVARQAVINLLKEIARMAAQKLAANIIGAIFGSVAGGMSGGGSTGMNFEGGSGAFTASEGITVPNYMQGGRVVKKSISDRLQSVSKPIKRAFKREGSKGVLGVFTPGEEILSIKTGEAGRYQALKRRLGTEPLEKIFQGNFAAGGTIDIEGNLLGQLSSINSPKISLNGVSNKPGKTTQNVQNITNFSANVVTPDADSFRASSYQTQQDIAEALIRARR